jgi:uncharacterized protein YjbJ (UPF0337 family)
MNKEEFKGALKELAGKVQEALGKLIGNQFQQDISV